MIATDKSHELTNIQLIHNMALWVLNNSATITPETLHAEMTRILEVTHWITEAAEEEEDS